MAKEKEYILLDRAEKKNSTEKGIWIACTLFPSERPKEVFFPFSQIKIEGDSIWVSDWILEQKERDLEDGEGILTA